MYAIFRYDKLKSGADVSAAVGHHLRLFSTKNADPLRTPLNEILAGPSGKDAPYKIAAHCAAQPARRADVVHAAGFVCTASPEFFQTGGDVEKWKSATWDWLKKEYGDRIIFANLQVDESTPHIQGIITVEDERGQRNMKKLFNPKNSRRWQTEYAKAVEHLGLKRGKEHSVAEHVSIKKFYADIDRAPVKAPTLNPLPQVPGILNRSEAELIAFAKKVRSETVAAVQPALSEAISKARAGATAVEQLAEERKIAAEKIKAVTEDRDKWVAAYEREKKMSAPYKIIPVDEVAEKLDMKFEKKTDSWISPEGEKFSLNADSGLWNSWTTGKGGRGAVALVQHVVGCTFGRAMAWIRTEFGIEKAAASMSEKEIETIQKNLKEAAAITPQPLLMPENTEHNWPVVRNYLTKKRGLDAALVDSLHAQKMLYASTRYEYDEKKPYPDSNDEICTNAVFAMVNPEGKETGAALRGVRRFEKTKDVRQNWVRRELNSDFHGLARGSDKSAGIFKIGSPEPRYVAITESAIDAISLFQKLKNENKDLEVAVVATCGSGHKNVLSYLDSLKMKPRKIILGHDNDSAGEAQADTLRDEIKGKFEVDRIKPRSKDWNDDLLADKRAGGSTFAYSSDIAFK